MDPAEGLLVAWLILCSCPLMTLCSLPATESSHHTCLSSVSPVETFAWGNFFLVLLPLCFFRYSYPFSIQQTLLILLVIKLLKNKSCSQLTPTDSPMWHEPFWDMRCRQDNLHSELIWKQGKHSTKLLTEQTDSSKIMWATWFMAGMAPLSCFLNCFVKF